MCTLAAESGRLDTLIWLHDEQGCLFDKRTCKEAIHANHKPIDRRKDTYVDIVNYVLECGCAFDCETMYHAIQKGDVHLVRRLADLGCPWCAQTSVERLMANIHGNKYPYEAAAVVGSVPMMNVLRDLGCPWDEEDESVFTALLCGNVDAAEFLLDMGVPWGDWADRSGQLQDMESEYGESVVKKARKLMDERGCPWTG